MTTTDNAIRRGLAMATPPARRQRSRKARLWSAFVRDRAAVVGLALAIVIALLAIGAPLLARHDPLDQSALNRLKPPDAEHPMGRDSFGRDVFARVLYAGRVSLVIGLGAVLIGGSVGTVLGLIAGHAGGRPENLIMRAVDVLMAFPSLLLGLTVLTMLGPGLEKMILAIGLLLTPPFARVIHGAALTIKRREFVEAARAIGAGEARIVGRHVLPNVAGEVVVLTGLWTATAIRVEASLSFIGLGVAPPTPTWGNMIREGVQHLTNAPWLSVFPGLAILLTALAFNMLGDGVRDALDPRLQQ
jgi:peptide/nickel transport system permease protein